jgi:uridine monophosphate synthetase
MTPNTEHSVLIHRLFEIGTIRFGEFTLKSGIKSPFYIDLRVVICYPDVLRRIGVLMAAEVSRCAGTASPASPMRACRSRSGVLAGNLPLIYPRKRKSYGTKRRIEGVFNRATAWS